MGRGRQLVPLLLVLAVVGTACAGGGGQTGPVTRLNVPLIGDATPNPIVQPGSIVDIMICKVMFNTLVKYSKEDGVTPAPDLAESWVSSADARVWTFNLRKNVKWHDGTPFTAEDVKFTFDLVMDPKVGSPSRGRVAGLQEVQVLDSHTVKFVFDRPVPMLLTQLAYNMGVVPKHALEGQDIKNPTKFYENPVGTGPYRFKGRVAGSHFTLEAFDGYWGGKPKIDQIVFKVLPDINTQVAQLKTGELDLTWAIEPHMLPSVEGVEGLRVDRIPVNQYFFICLNNENPLFADKRVRQAMMYALDRQAIVEQVLGGTVEIAHHATTPVLKQYYTDDVRKYGYDPEKAKALLAEAGWKPGPDGTLQKDGKRFSFTIKQDRGNPVREQVVQIAQEYWKKIGMEVNLQFGDWNSVLAEYKKGDYEAHMNWWIMPPDPDLYVYFAGDGSNNRPRCKFPELDRLLAEARSEVDTGKRVALYHQVQQFLAEEVPMLWLYYWKEIRVVNDRVEDLPTIGYRDALLYVHEATLRQGK